MNRKKIPEVLTPDEREALLGAVIPNTPLRLRNLCILKLFLNAGLRLAELIALRRDHLDLKIGQLKVNNGKGGKDRILWLNDDDLALITQWLAYKDAHIPKRRGERLLTTLKGGPLCRRHLQELIPRLARQAGINKRVHAHTLRHTFATDLLRKTGNLFVVQRAMGHSQITTTTVYLHLADSELQSALKNLRKDNEP